MSGGYGQTGGYGGIDQPRGYNSSSSSYTSNSKQTNSRNECPAGVGAIAMIGAVYDAYMGHYDKCGIIKNDYMNI